MIMTKKKSKKKEDKKKIAKKKKKILSLKLKKKKDSKKKDSKKKDSKKKKERKKKDPNKIKPITAAPETKAESITSNAPVVIKEDHSSNYNVKEAVVKLKAIKGKTALLSFTKGETRLTVTKVIPAALNRL